MKDGDLKCKSLKVRIYPEKSQITLIEKTFGCARFVYNYLLEERLNYHNLVKKGKRDWKGFVPTTEKELKNKRNYKFLQEVSSVALQQSRINLDRAYSNFFNNIKGKNNSNANSPKFHSKKNKQSYREVMISKDCFNTEEKTIRITKIGIVKYHHTDEYPRWFNYILEARNITVSKSKSGKYYCSIMFSIDKDYKGKCNRNSRKTNIGLDFDLDDLYVDNYSNTGSDYGFYKVKQHFNKKLSKIQRNFSRKEKGSKNREKVRIKLSKLEEHISNIRKDFIEKETLRLVKSFKNISIEDLNIKEMIQNSHNARNYVDTSWGLFVEKLKSKGKDYDCNIIVMDRYFPSSKLCSNCGFKNIKLKVEQKSWKCPNCKKKWDRDLNAAINIFKEGNRIRLEK